MRNGVSLSSLNLSSVIYKVWSGVPLDRYDLQRIDARASIVADVLGQIENLGVNDDRGFESLLPSLDFSSLLSSDCFADLTFAGCPAGCPPGSSTPLTLRSGWEVASRTRRVALLACAPMIQSAYDGVVSIVPAAAFALMEWNEIESVAKKGGKTWTY